VEFHPVAYAYGLAAAVEGDGSRVFEGTRARGVAEGSPVRVDTDHGSLTGDRVVVATHYPVWDRGLYFARMETTRSYCVAGRVRGEPSRATRRPRPSHRTASPCAGSPPWPACR